MAESKKYGESYYWRKYGAASQFLDQRIGWHRLPRPLGLAVLIGLRSILRKQNLFDTTPLPSINTAPVAPLDTATVKSRSSDGTHNDLGQPAMGMAGSRFGRNIPLENARLEPPHEMLSPSPREVSRALLTRNELIPATSVNALTAAWLQFMIRDWFSHGESLPEDPWEVQLSDDDSWYERPMKIFRTKPDPTRPAGPNNNPPTFINSESHWWDASQLYGSGLEQQKQARSGVGGKLRIDDEGLPPQPSDEGADPARKPGFWLGLLMMQTLFTLEHNSICDRLRAEYPTWSDEEFFQHARLINAALIAKIHTVEWTPAVISHPTTVTALRLNWWGLAGERVHRLFGRISSSEVISGIPGSSTDHFGVPYALTEEFAGVYRMHPLVPDDFRFRSIDDDRLLKEATLRDISGPGARAAVGEVSMANVCYTFGTMHPGLVTLHNFPRFLQEFERPDGRLADLAATDILRAREQGVPRYNEFRRLLHLAPAKSFHDLADNPEDAEILRRTYGDIDRVDLMVGMFAERRPKGFAFSDTAFRIFILMASRRLNSDRFFTKDFTSEVYTKAGMDWIDANSMATVLKRHFPTLGVPMRDAMHNAFTPWQSDGKTV